MNVAVSGLPAPSMPVPITLVPSLNVTVLEGVPLPGAAALTVAVKVTDWPSTAELALAVSVVVVVSLPTVTCEAGEAEGMSLASPNE